MKGRLLCLALAACVSGACANSAEQSLGTPPFGRAPAPHVVPPAPLPDDHEPAEGSLWRGDASKRFLAFENRATRVGDLVTVLIDESATAQNQATTELERETEMEAKLNSDISLQTVVTRPILNLLNFLGFTDNRSDDTPTAEVSIIDAQTSSSYDGEGKASRQASFTTKVACLVTDVTSTGLLRVEGSRNMTINNETQVIRLAGYVRPEDVQIDNTVPSALIASAEIEYTGIGVISEEQSVPWMQRLFKWILPF